MTTAVALAVVLAASASSLAGCSGGGDAPPAFSGVRAESISSSYTSNLPGGAGDDLHTVTPRGAELEGPHYTMGVKWIATGTTLGAKDAESLGTSPVRAGKGETLLLAAIDPQDTYAAFEGGAVEAGLTVGEQWKRVPQLPLPPSGDGALPDDSVLLLVSAPARTPVRLRAMDSGRSQELDLRTGKVLVDGYELRQSPKRVEWKGSTPVAYDDADFGLVPAKLSVGSAVPYDVQQASAVASLTSYTPDLAWAPKGSAILTVPAPGLTADDTPTLKGAAYFDLHEEFDDRSVFTFHTENGRTIRAQPYKRNMPVSSFGIGGDAGPITFVVPAGTTSGTVTMDLAEAQLTHEHGKQHRNVSWSRTPGPVSVRLSFGS